MASFSKIIFIFQIKLDRIESRRQLKVTLMSLSIFDISPKIQKQRFRHVVFFYKISK